MATITQETRFELARDELVTLTDARNHVLVCESGGLWITIDGDGRDIILGPGQSQRLDTAAPVVVSAIRPATLSVRRQEDSGPRAAGAKRKLVSLLQWEFPPLASFPAPLIR